MKLKESRENYLKMIYKLGMVRKPVRGSDLAAALGVSKPTVSVSLKELEKAGDLRLDTARTVHLTPKGEETARMIYERHRTFCSWLEKLGVDRETAEQDACKMEHAVSAQSYRAIKQMLEKEENEPADKESAYDDQ